MSTSKGPTNADWEEMRSIITYIWVNRARSFNDLKVILRREYSFRITSVIASRLPLKKQPPNFAVLTISRRKATWGTRVDRWHLRTYKKKALCGPLEKPLQPVRKRKRSLSEQAPEPQRPHHILPSPWANRLVRLNVYQLPEFIQYSIDRFIVAVFGNAVQQFTHLDLIRPKLNDGMWWRWQRIADLYLIAQNNFRAQRPKKCRSGLKNAHQELRILFRWGSPGISRLKAKVKEPSALRRLEQAMEPPPVDTQHTFYHCFLAKFWRTCFQLLRGDGDHEFSFVTDFLLELESLFYSVGNNIRLLQYILQYYCNISYCNIIAIQYMVIRISCNTILELSIPIYIADYCNIGIAFFCHFGTCEL
jgi:hypothetical protein